MSGLNMVNDVVAFVIELVLLFSVGYAGFRAPGPMWLRVLLAIVLPVAMALLWGVFAAPRSAARLSMPSLLLFKLAAFGTGTAAFYFAGQPRWALIFGIVAAVHLTLATVAGKV